jgi:hypothetical protein
MPNVSPLRIQGHTAMNTSALRLDARERRRHHAESVMTTLRTITRSGHDTRAVGTAAAASGTRGGWDSRRYIRPSRGAATAPGVFLV